MSTGVNEKNKKKIRKVNRNDDFFIRIVTNKHKITDHVQEYHCFRYEIE